MFLPTQNTDRYFRNCIQEKEKDNSVEKQTRQSIHQTFNFRKYCLFCGEECIDINPKSPSRWRPYYLV